MFATGPYAHETQLVSPLVFSTFTTKPSTAPLTPPPELAHLSTTPSSPKVPYAQYLLSSRDVKVAQYPLYPESPASSLRSPISRVSSGGNGYQGWQNTSRSPKQDAEELEAYRASFGFSADEIITTAQYAETAEVADDSFTIRPPVEEIVQSPPVDEKQMVVMKSQTNLRTPKGIVPESDLGESSAFTMSTSKNRGK
ncbi:hypothetical protein SAY86_013264 [Trapa natans]|uniref:Uncharacterized protein n=1 Tax=Trapa natans TaxID=22666 RepID=A0AAN7LYE1_TRANT|nr:hypothetical protein SAY86_013264 [Trapa natans]